MTEIRCILMYFNCKMHLFIIIFARIQSQNCQDTTSLFYVWYQIRVYEYFVHRIYSASKYLQVVFYIHICMLYFHLHLAHYMTDFDI